MSCLFALQTSLASRGVRDMGGVCLYPFLGFVGLFLVGFQTALLRNTLRNFLLGTCPFSKL